MEQEITFENTRMVLEAFALELVERYKGNIISKGHRASGDLIRSIGFDPEDDIVVNNGRVIVTLNLNWYWKILEEGLKPDGLYKNPGNFSGLFKAILNWVEIKKLPARTYSGKLPGKHTLSKDTKTRNKQLAAMISHKILREGTTPTHLLSDSIQQTRSKFNELISEALMKDIDENLDVAMGYFTGYTTA